jgi:hypothetical protein
MLNVVGREMDLYKKLAGLQIIFIIVSMIKKSCNTKRELYKTIKSSNDPGLKEHKKYCKVLGRVILTAKKRSLIKIIKNSNNKIKTTWKVIKNINGNNQISTNVTCLNINGNSTQNHQKIVDPV